MLFQSLIAGFAAVQLVSGHGAIIKAVGDMGGSGTALGIDASTPRDGSKREPFQADSTRFKNNNVDACGETLGGGANEPTQQMQKMIAGPSSMPMVSAGGTVMMTLHQVNGDGAGPYSCMIDSTGTGMGGWSKMEPLTAKIAADQTCTGTVGDMQNVCMVRCNNNANAGPFGGCVPVQMMSGGSATAANAAAAPNAANAATTPNAVTAANSMPMASPSVASSVPAAARKYKS